MSDKIRTCGKCTLFDPIALHSSEGFCLVYAPRIVHDEDECIYPRNKTVFHHVKCWPEYYQGLVDGVKTFDLRFNDRDYQVGDFLVLQEWDKENGYSKREAKFEITYILENFHGLMAGYVILGVKMIRQP